MILKKEYDLQKIVPIINNVILLQIFDNQTYFHKKTSKFARLSADK